MSFHKSEDGQKRVKEALLENDGLLDAILDGSPVPQFAIDHDHRVIYWNKALEIYSGIKEEAVAGTNQHWMAFYREERPCIADLIVDGKSDEAGKSCEGTYRQSPLVEGAFECIDFFPAAGENGAWLDMTARAIKDGGGNVIGALVTLEDVTGLMQAREELKKYRDSQDALVKRLVALTEPLETSDVSFTDLFDIDEIQKLQDAFAEAMNVASIITNPDGTPITRPSNFCRLCIDIIRKTEKGLANCYYSDSIIGRQNPEGPIIQPCLSGGLWDAGASITLGGKHIANWLIGQVKNEAIDEEKALRYADQIGADKEEFRKALLEVPVMSKEQFQKIANVLFLFANELSLKAYQNVQQARFIAGRMQAERALEESKDYLDRIINSVADPIFVKDRRHRFVLINDAFCHYIGRSRGEILGKSDYDFFPMDQADGFWARDELVYTTGAENLNEEELTDAKGAVHIIVTKRTLYTDKTGEKFIVGIIRDITDLKRTEAELRRHRDHLEELVAERTASLKGVNKELKQEIVERRKAEEALVDAKAQVELYVDLMCHDINNLNQVGIGFLTMALDTLDLGEERSSLILKPLQALENSSKLIGNVRKLRRASEGGFTLYEIDLRRMISDLMPQFSGIADMDVTVNLSGGECRVMANDLLTDVLSNIVGNAIKHSTRPLDINICMNPATVGDRQFCAISIEDNGPGIPDDLKKKLFTRFQRGVTKASGMGLGLYLVRTLVEDFHGKVWVEDRVPGDYSKGIRFVVMLPAVEKRPSPDSADSRNS